MGFSRGFISLGWLLQNLAPVTGEMIPSPNSLEMAVMGIGVEHAEILKLTLKSSVPVLPFPSHKYTVRIKKKKVKFSSLSILVHGFIRQKTYSIQCVGQLAVRIHVEFLVLLSSLKNLCLVKDPCLV